MTWKPLPVDTTETCDCFPSWRDPNRIGGWSRDKSAKDRCGKPARFIHEMTCGCGACDMTHRECEACHLKGQEQARDPLPDRNDKTLTIVRELGFDTHMSSSGTIEKVFFLGPQMRDGQEEGAHATEEAVLGFIAYFESQIAVARDYLANGRNNKTNEWSHRNEL